MFLSIGVFRIKSLGESNEIWQGEDEDHGHGAVSGDDVRDGVRLLRRRRGCSPVSGDDVRDGATATSALAADATVDPDIKSCLDGKQPFRDVNGRTPHAADTKWMYCASISTGFEEYDSNSRR